MLGAGGALVATLGARTTVSLSGALPIAVALVALLGLSLRARTRSVGAARDATGEPARA